MYLELHYQADMEPKNQALDPETLMTIQIAPFVLCDYIMLVIATFRGVTNDANLTENRGIKLYSIMVPQSWPNLFRCGMYKWEKCLENCFESATM